MALTDKLTAIANAIRGKTGKTEPLTLDAMPGEIEGISTGGASEYDLIMARIAGTWPSGDLVIHGELNKIENYGFYGAPITSLTIPDADFIPNNYCFCQCKELKTVSAPNATKVYTKTFVGCDKLSEIYLPKVSHIDGDQFLEGTALKELNLPSLTTKVYSHSIRNNKQLEKVELGKCTQIYNNAFMGCSVLAKVVLRTENVCTLSNINAFQDTPFASGGTGGTVYVPGTLIEQYQQATNWSTLYSAGTCNFVAIEGSEYE